MNAATDRRIVNPTVIRTATLILNKLAATQVDGADVTDVIYTHSCSSSSSSSSSNSRSNKYICTAVI